MQMSTASIWEEWKSPPSRLIRLDCKRNDHKSGREIVSRPLVDRTNSTSSYLSDIGIADEQELEQVFVSAEALARRERRHHHLTAVSRCKRLINTAVGVAVGSDSSPTRTRIEVATDQRHKLGVWADVY